MKNWTDSSNILVTVCCTTFNHERYIRDAINSFLMQETDFAFEIIVHDDASTDSTPDIIREYAEAYPGLIRPILQTENQYSKAGLINPRFVFPAARGKYLALCEADDYWTDRQKLQKQVEFLESNPDYVITYTDCQPFDENGPIDEEYGGAKKDLSALDLKRATPIATLTACFRNVIGDIPPDLLAARYGDFVTWSLLGSHGKGKYLPEIQPSAYRVHGGGIHSSKDEVGRAKMRLITISALHAYYTRLGDDKMASFFRTRMFFTILQIMGFGRLYRFARAISRVQRRLAHPR